MSSAFHQSLDRCPHCGIAKPYLATIHVPDGHYNYYDCNNNVIFPSSNDFPAEAFDLAWKLIICTSCGKLILFRYFKNPVDNNWGVVEVYPSSNAAEIDEIERYSSYVGQLLKRSFESKDSNPEGAIVSTSKAVNKMLMALGDEYLKKDNMFDRMELAKENHRITHEMWDWANETRLWANNERHSEGDDELRTKKEADEVLQFAITLAVYLIVLPQRVKASSAQRKKIKDEGKTGQVILKPFRS